MSKKKRNIKSGKKDNHTNKNQLSSNGIPVLLYPDIVILYRFMPLEAFEATMKSWSLKATLSYEANDPFEFMPQSVKSGAPADFRANSSLSSPPPFICFSRQITKASMWGLYADSGRGVCMVFGIPVTEVVWQNDKPAKERACVDGRKHVSGKSKYVNAMNNSLLLPVKYSELRVSPPEKLKEIDVSEESVQEWFLNLISSKDKTWENEDEVRLVCDYEYADSTDYGKVCFSWPMNYLLGVAVGPRCKYSPAIIRKLLQDAYMKSGDNQNYFLCRSDGSNGSIIDGFIVSQAYYHWQRYEMECMPWANRINGELYVQLVTVAYSKITKCTYKDMDARTREVKNLDMDRTWSDISGEIFQQGRDAIIALSGKISTSVFIQSPLSLPFA